MIGGCGKMKHLNSSVGTQRNKRWTREAIDTGELLCQRQNKDTHLLKSHRRRKEGKPWIFYKEHPEEKLLVCIEGLSCAHPIRWSIAILASLSLCAMDVCWWRYWKPYGLKNERTLTSREEKQRKKTRVAVSRHPWESVFLATENRPASAVGVFTVRIT